MRMPKRYIRRTLSDQDVALSEDKPILPLFVSILTRHLHRYRKPIAVVWNPYQDIVMFFCAVNLGDDMRFAVDEPPHLLIQICAIELLWFVE